jgi:hypothetical protein
VATITASRRIAGDVSFGLLGAALVACAFAFAALGAPPLPPAPMVVAGIASPLTGMTRSFVALAGGDVPAAFVLHPLGPLCFAACVAAAGNAIVVLRSGRRARVIERVFAVPHAPWLVALTFGAVWIRQILFFG